MKARNLQAAFKNKPVYIASLLKARSDSKDRFWPWEMLAQMAHHRDITSGSSDILAQLKYIVLFVQHSGTCIWK